MLNQRKAHRWNEEMVGFSLLLLCKFYSHFFVQKIHTEFSAQKEKLAKPQ